MPTTEFMYGSRILCLRSECQGTQVGVSVFGEAPDKGKITCQVESQKQGRSNSLGTQQGVGWRPWGQSHVLAMTMSHGEEAEALAPGQVGHCEPSAPRKVTGTYFSHSKIRSLNWVTP